MRYFFTLILFSIHIYVFTQDYTPLVKEGRYWIYNHYNHSSCFLMGLHSTEVRYFSGDTLINSKSYKKLISSLATSQLPPYEISSRKTLCWMREDTLQKKVFMVNFDENVFPCTDSSNEILIWDFGLKVGDTLPDCLIQIFNPVDFGDAKSFVLDSIHGKEFYCLGVPPGICGDLALWPVKFTEGFGMEDGPIYKRFGTFLTDYCEGTLEQCNIISSTQNEMESNQVNITLFPNPVVDVINLKTASEIKKIEIIDRNGRTVISSPGTEINVSQLLTGVYFLKCYSVDNKLYYSKFVKI
ncbi:MAG: T9SS type A sorting domain-containing protein [Lewinellaceae bacterium]|nr:T9SS type A sorting domain-containing protein [Lewinellaceae bacterium]